MRSLLRLALTAAALFCGIASASAQAWTATYNLGDDCYPVQIKVDSSGNTYVVGTRNTSGQDDIVLLKYNSSGTLLWKTAYIGTSGGDDSPAGMAIDNSGNVYITGTAYRGTTNRDDIITLKYNSSGTLQWIKVYNGSGNSDDLAAGIRIDSSGNAYVTGSVVRTSYDIVALKYSSDGTQQWVVVYNGTSNGTDNAHDIALDSGNNPIIVGDSYRGATNGYDAVVLKLDSATGSTTWVRVYNSTSSGDDTGTAITVDSSDAVIFAGASGNGTNNDYVVLKYDSAGTTQWAKRYNNGGNDAAHAIAADNQDNIYVTGVSSSTSAKDGWATLKYDSSGNLLWTQRTANMGDDSPNAVIVDSSYNVYVAGYVTGDTSSNANNADAYVAKYDSTGNLVYSTRYNGSANDTDSVEAMVVSEGNIYVLIATSTGTRYNMVTAKYVP
jgi:uncharacterized delta-60 repeat protein